MAHTERARPAPRGIRIRKARVAGLVAVGVATAALSLNWRPSSSSDDPPSSTAVPHVSRGDQSRSPSETGGLDPAGRLGLGATGGAIPDGTTVFDDGVPGVAKISPDLLGALRRAATDAASDGVRIAVDSGWRSPEYQERLLRDAILKYGSEAEATRWVASPTTSAHVSGDAVDIGPANATSWLSAHGAAYGLCQVYDNEPWHYELRPEAIGRGCPTTYPDPTHDPRMQR